MPKGNLPGHLLTASIDLESRKTPEEKAAEEAKIRKYAEYERTIRERGCQKKSLEVLEGIARYLREVGFTSAIIWCGMLYPERQWKVFIGFATENMSEEERVEARWHILSLFLDEVQPETDMILNGDEFLTPLLFGAKWYWKNWRHTTEILMNDGRIFVPLRDGKGDLAEENAYSDSVRETTNSIRVKLLYWGIAAISSVFMWIFDLKRVELTIDEAVKKLNEPSCAELEEDLLFSLADTIQICKEIGEMCAFLRSQR